MYGNALTIAVRGALVAIWLQLPLPRIRAPAHKRPLTSDRLSASGDVPSLPPKPIPTKIFSTETQAAIHI